MFQAPATHTTALTDAWEFWDPVTQCRHSPEGLWANAVQREGGMSGSNSVLDQFLKLGLGFFFLVRRLIKILLLRIRSGSCCANVTQSQEKQREDGCLQTRDQ